MFNRVTIKNVRGLAETLNQYYRDTTTTGIALEIEQSDGIIKVFKWRNGECIECLRGGTAKEINHYLRGMAFVLRECADSNKTKVNFDTPLSPNGPSIVEAYKNKANATT